MKTKQTKNTKRAAVKPILKGKAALAAIKRADAKLRNESKHALAKTATAMKKSAKLPIPPRKIVADPKKDGIPVELQTQNRNPIVKLVPVTNAPETEGKLLRMITTNKATSWNLPKTVTPQALKIIAERDEQKTLKSRARVSKMLAKKNGETTKMPLEGKAALAAIAQAAIENGHPITKVPAGVRGKVAPKPAATAKTEAKPAKQEKTVAKTKSKTEKPKSSKRASTSTRYDWSAAEEGAKLGKLPPTPDFSANTHKYYRPQLQDVVSLVKKRNLTELKKLKIEGTCYSPSVIKRYQALCITALAKK